MTRMDDDEELEDEELVVTLNERPHPEDDESLEDEDDKEIPDALPVITEIQVNGVPVWTDDAEIDRFDQAARQRFEEQLQAERDQRYYDPKPGSPEAEKAMRDMIRQEQPDLLPAQKYEPYPD